MSNSEAHPRNDWGHDDAPTTEQFHELAEIERLLREDARATDVHVHAGGDGAHISWTSLDLNIHSRGSCTAAVCSEIVLSSAWGLACIHDPHDTDEGTVSALTVVYDPDTEAGQ